MTNWAVVDSSLLLLLIVGRAGTAYIEQHERLRNHYDASDYRQLVLTLDLFTGIVVVPQVLAEVSNLARYIGEPARSVVLEAFRGVVDAASERWLRSADVMQAPDFQLYGLTDAILLRLCADETRGVRLTLLTADQPLAYRAQSLGHRVINYREL